MSEYAIEAEKISKVYRLYDRPRDRFLEAIKPGKRRSKDHYALTDVDLKIKKGETVGIIGTNGSGKSTILKIITGVLSPTSGSITVNGRISALLELGAGFNMEYSGIENVYLNGTMMGFSREEIDAKLDDILEFADIGDFVYQPVKSYSSGMFVRLAFAVAINIDPEILIVDEALSVGDVFFQSKCYHKFEEFKEQGKTILFVSHDLSSIAKYCDRVILLNKGIKLDEGCPKEMIDAYIANEKNKVWNSVAEAGGDMTKVKGDSLFPVLNMLNTKYFIMPLQAGQTVPVQNLYAYGNAWFVDKVNYVNNANEEIAGVGKYNLRHEAVADAKFKEQLGQSVPQDDTSIVRLTQYKPNNLVYEVNSNKGGVVVFSEIYYPGWTATVDGQTAELGRVNYILRALQVKPGKHTVVLDFHPASLRKTETVAYVGYGILVLLIIIGIIVEMKKRKKEDAV